MASELLKTKALAARIKEPKVRDFDFGLNLTSVESLIPDLPEPKPQELLDIQEDNRKGRLLDSLNKIGGGLMDESVDFIERNEMAIGGGAIEGEDLGTREGFARPISAERLKFLNEEAVKEGYPDYFSIDPKTERAVRIRVGQAATRRQKGVVEGKGKVKPTEAQKANIKKSHWANKSKAEVDAILNSPKQRAYWARKTQNQLDVLKMVQSGKYKTAEEIRKAVGLTEDVFKKEVKNLFKNVYTHIGDLNKPKKMQSRFGVNFLPRDLDEMYELRSKLGQIDGFDSVEQRNIYQQIDEAYGQKGTNPNRKAFAEATKKASDFSRVKNAIKAKYPDIRLELDHPLDYKTIKDLGKGGEKFLFVTPVDKAINRGFKATLGDAYAKAIKAKDKANILKIENLAQDIGVTIGQVRGTKVMDYGTGPLRTTDIGQEIIDNLRKQNVIVDNVKKLEKSGELKTRLTDIGMPRGGETGYSAKKVSETKIKNIAKQLASFGFKCSASEGGACDNPMNYLDDIKKQQAIAKGSGNAATNAAKKLSAGKTIMREFIGPAALGFELAAAVPITYLGYKAGLPPARIVSDATYGLFGDTEKARLKKEAVKAGIDTSEIQKSLDFEKASGAMQTLAQQEGEFRGPDDEMLFPQQYEKGEEDFYKAVGAFRDKAGNVSKDVYQKFGSQLQQLRDYIAQTDADTAAERSSKIPTFGIGDYIDFNSGGRVNYSNGSDGTDLAIKESLEAFKRYLEAGGKLGYKDFIALGNEGVSKFFNSGGRVGFADGDEPPDPKRRLILKGMGILGLLPFGISKLFKATKPVVQQLANTTTKMPDWFPNFVDRFINKGIGNKIDADLTEYSVKELPDVKLLKQDNGAIRVEGKNAYNEEYYIDYEPPGVEVVDYNTGKTVKTKGDFVATDTEYRMISPEDYDIDGVNVDEIDDILGGSSTKLEGFAKGTNKEKYTIGQRRIDEADARGASKDESLRADINDPYGDIDPTDFTDD